MMIGADWVHVRRGAGEPLVLIHGLGSRWQVWQPVLETVARHREVIAFDLPGFGGTPPGDIPPTLDGLTTAVQGFLDCHGLHRPHVAGSSLGGGIALELGRRGAARSVTAFSPIGFWAAAGRHWSRAALTGSRALARHLPVPVATRLAGSRAGRTAVLSLFFGRPWRPGTSCCPVVVISRSPTTRRCALRCCSTAAPEGQVPGDIRGIPDRSWSAPATRMGA